MKTYERDGLRAMLEKIAVELETANARTRESAARYAERYGAHAGACFQVGGLGFICTEQGAVIRAAIRSYLTPRRTAQRTRSRARRSIGAV